MSEPTNIFSTQNGMDFHGTNDSDQEQQEQPEQQVNPVNAADSSADSQNSVPGNMATSLQIRLQPFNGQNQPDKLWIRNFEQLCVHKNINDESKCNILPLYLSGNAQFWFDSLSAVSTATFKDIKEAFLKRWDDSATNKWSLLNQYLSSAQNIGESALDFIDRVTRIATQLDRSDVNVN